MGVILEGLVGRGRITYQGLYSSDRMKFTKLWTPSSIGDFGALGCLVSYSSERQTESLKSSLLRSVLVPVSAETHP